MIVRCSCGRDFYLAADEILRLCLITGSPVHTHMFFKLDLSDHYSI